MANDSELQAIAALAGIAPSNLLAAAEYLIINGLDLGAIHPFAAPIS